MIAFNDALNFEAYTARIASDDQHVAYENVALDEFYTTAYSELYEQCRRKICTQMYMSFLKRVQVYVGDNFPRFRAFLVCIHFTKTDVGFVKYFCFTTLVCKNRLTKVF